MTLPHAVLWRRALPYSWRLPHHQGRRIALPLAHRACTRAASTTTARADDGSPSAAQQFLTITHDPANTTQDELLSGVRPIEPDGGQSSGVLLLSKHFASWLASDNAFLHKFVNRLWKPIDSQGDQPPQAQFSLLASVVDGLPRPGTALVLDWHRNEAQSYISNRSRLVHSVCCEGLAFASCTSNSLGVLREAQSAEKPPGNFGFPNVFSSPHDQKTISFTMPHLIKTRAEHPAGSTTVTLPLANTLFQTGVPSTTCISHWRRNNTMYEMLGRNDGVVGNGQVHLPSPVLGVDDDNSVCRQGDYVYRTRIATHLEPLTAYRQVKLSMGNVISKMTMETRDGPTEFPASQELEVAVSKYLDKQKDEAHGFSVWAMIVPQEVFAKHPNTKELLEDPWSEDLHRKEGKRTNFTKSLYPLIWERARLHRILSGGGGWGQKAGLLSLDPATDYSGNTHAPQSSAVDTPAEKLAIVQDLAAPGDWLGFYAAPNHLPSNPSIYSTIDKASKEIASSLDFGVRLSSVDELEPASGAAHRVVDVFPKILTFQRHFGALSEGGMALHRSSHTPMWSTHTRLDAPFTNVIFCTSNQSRDYPPPTDNPIQLHLKRDKDSADTKDQPRIRNVKNKLFRKKNVQQTSRSTKFNDKGTSVARMRIKSGNDHAAQRIVTIRKFPTKNIAASKPISQPSSSAGYLGRKNRQRASKVVRMVKSKRSKDARIVKSKRRKTVRRVPYTKSAK